MFGRVLILLKNPRDRLLRWLTYFRRGHNAYLVFLVSFANFVVIQYRLLIQYVPALKMIFTSLTAFVIAFFLVYIPLAITIGWYDYKKFAVLMERRLGALANPRNRDISKALMLIAQGEMMRMSSYLRK